MIETNKTDRGTFYNSTVYRAMREILAETKASVLDFGAGRNAVFAKKLNEEFGGVDAWECGGNKNENHVDEMGFYDIIYASNVLNVQFSLEDLRGVLNLIKAHCGTFVFNYPSAPRKMGLTTREMLGEVGKVFKLKRINKDVWMGESA